jgi:hypothetical protein
MSRNCCHFGDDPVKQETARLSLATAILSVATETSRDVEILKKAGAPSDGSQLQVLAGKLSARRVAFSRHGLSKMISKSRIKIWGSDTAGRRVMWAPDPRPLGHPEIRAGRLPAACLAHEWVCLSARLAASLATRSLARFCLASWVAISAVRCAFRSAASFSCIAPIDRSAWLRRSRAQGEKQHPMCQDVWPGRASQDGTW